MILRVIIVLLFTGIVADLIGASMCVALDGLFGDLLKRKCSTMI